MSTHALDLVPKELNKKFLLLKHFSEFLEGSKDEFQEENDSEERPAGITSDNQFNSNIMSGRNSTGNARAVSGLKGPSKGAGEDASQPALFVMVKKWMRTKHAILFRLNNKVV